MMRLPSIRSAASEARRTLRRFPVVLVCALVAAAVGNLMMGAGDHDGLQATMAAATLGLPLFTVITVTAERLRQRYAELILGGLALALLLAFALAWPHWSGGIQLRRYFQFSVGVHLLAAFLPFVRGGEPNGF